jgi:glyoxylase-like metal-dependent hydrolase (beta-lactamase superfamily II)
MRAIYLLLWGMCLSACTTLTAQPGNNASPQQVANGAYAFMGSGGDIAAANQGRIGNAGFIVGSKGVLVVDSGVSHAHGQAMLAGIAQVTTLPVKAVLLTHAMQEFLFGATAFQAADAKLYMHAKSADVMKQRCNNCLKQLNATLGEAVMKGSHVPTPDVAFTDVPLTEQQLSELIGRDIRLLYYGASSGPGDVAVWDAQTRVLFSGAMVESQRLPDTRDAKISGWVKALDALIALKPVKVVAGHGALSDERMMLATRDYLVSLDKAVSKLVDQGISLTDASAMAPQREYQTWDQYATIHGPNVHRSYLEHERKLFDATAVKE